MHDETDQVFIKLLIQACIQHLCQTSSIHVFKENPESIIEIVTIPVLDNVFVIANCHHGDLITHALLLLRSLHGFVNILQCIVTNWFFTFFGDEVNLTVAALSNHFDY